MDNGEMDDSIKGIAIIGLVGRFPGAKDVKEFWQNLCNGQESISFFNEEELAVSGIDIAWLHDPQYVRAGARLSDIEMFDAPFFDFSPREAEIMDPQHRIILECAWQALENAGYAPGVGKGLSGVYVGTNLSIYMLDNLGSNPDVIKSMGSSIFFNNVQDFAATRVSYKLDLKGPSINISTACSTSLVAVHSACQGLLNYECDLALAGGISIQSLQKQGYFYEEGGITSADGHCRAFDAKANGTVFGDGVGIVVLKRLEDALADGDCIHAVIKGSAINNDGAAKVGYTAPSVGGQGSVIAEAQAIAGFNPETITYIETHGTGTSLGDPIEISALKKVFEARTKNNGFCAIGSVKPNVGHQNIAAGVTSLIKTVMALKHGLIPPSLHFEHPNPEIDFANSPFYVNTKLSDWKTNGTPRRAGVSSFGIGGTNAHVLLEEAPVIEASSPSRPWQLLLLSAKTSTALETVTTELCTHLEQNPDIFLPDVAYTLQVGRRAFDYRRIVVCSDQKDAVKLLDNQDPLRVVSHHRKPSHCPVIFMFSGQGSQYANMAQELYEIEATFRRHVDSCAEILQPHLGLDIRSLLYPKEQDTETASKRLQQTALTQSALFVTEYALAQLLMSWGVQPEAMIGHSIGEYVAATVAGVFSLEDALLIVAKRGELMQQVPTGSMLAIRLPEKDVRSLLSAQTLYKNSLQIAAINSPSSCVVSGTNEAVATLKNQLSSQQVECRLLHTSHAFHSVMMEPILEAFLEAVKKVKLNPPRIRFISNVTGSWITDAQATNPDYWCQHLRETVRFSDGISLLLQQFEGVFLEVGPGRTLSTLTTQHLDKNTKQQVLTSLRHIQDQQSDVNFLLQTLGRLWLAGLEIDWSGFYTHEQRHRLPLPTYPFERQRYWIDAKSPSPSLNSKSVKLDNKQDIVDWFYVPSWKRSFLPNSSSDKIGSTQDNWLFFVDDLGVGEKLINALINQGKNVIAVKQGEQFSKLSDDVYTINPYRCEDYDALFRELSLFGKIPQNIAYLWSIGKLENCQSRKFLEFKSLLFLTQSFSKLKISDGLRPAGGDRTVLLDNQLQLWIISNNIQDVNGNETLDPEKATILGLCKVIPQEYPNIICRCIDIALTNCQVSEDQKGNYNSNIIDQLLSEFTALSSDLIVAYRDFYRWVQIFEPLRLESVVEEKTPLRKRGVYLFPGGLENIGVLIAEYLAKSLQAKLIFIEDSAFPEKDDFSQWLETRTQEDEVSNKIKKLLALEELGAKVLVMRSDITNYEQIHQTLAPENIGQIHGVIYSTGIKRKNIFSSIPEIGNIELENLFDSQHHQITLLEQVLQKRKLDFCLVFSSLSSVLGGFGLGLYSAANNFIDTFTNRHNRTHSLPWYTLNWDKVQLNTTEEQKALGQVSGVELAITPTETVEVFKRIFSLDKPTQVIVSTVDLKARCKRIFDLDSLPDSKSFSQIDSFSLYSRPNLSNSYLAPTNELEKQITEIWQKVLGITEIGVYDNFYELGGDSLIATQLVSRLREKFPVELPLRDLLLEAMIPVKQAEMIEQLLLEKIEELSEEEAELLLGNRADIDI
ncbi:acyltransferase domain-containing protein [Nostoc cf. edaphicum LEGE 07299]|uniref:Acyltransferase domain-containing protein n=1 Tax=Nostoc cf. edaphicum LEGE 07299 TaxID=2777974 RepID=A0ABR9TVQ1_9NOSO|nr:type I polyketide synthase [Nostoc edaphicum]MBE9104486.1 acyltransferase domain-containing protein [Nostoc cf. edaphicum LEGE 07299]